MNLNISYNWLKEYVRTSMSAQEFAKKISLVGPSVDHITEIKLNFEKVVVGQIMKIDNHPDADKLKVCKVNIGPHGIKTAIPGGKSELQIVCGAPNIKEGQKVPVVLAGGKVGDMEIKQAKIRGVESFGMMCSQKELGLGDDYSGIFILPDDTKIGESLDNAIPLNDFILDVEITSNRPDAMSVIGLAREAAAALGTKFTWKEINTIKPGSRVPPKWRAGKPGMTLKVKVKEKKLCPRYQAVIMTDIKITASPLWMQQRLIASGMRPINNLVDITNYILLEFGQPMHVFDYEKIKGGEIIVRLAQPGEKILALDGKEYELADNQLVIADKQSPIAVAGVMGGELSAATAETKIIVFECANFDQVSVRKTSRALNLRSDSSNLYEKGISPENTMPALMRAIQLAQEICGAKVASAIIDEKSYKRKDKAIKLALSRVDQILGVKVSSAEVKKFLEALGFSVKSKTNDILEVMVPWWRDSDILGDHDLIEEIARMHGYFNLPAQIMAGDIPVVFLPLSKGEPEGVMNDPLTLTSSKTSPNPSLERRGTDDEFYWEDKIKDFLAGFGLTEIYTYSFISEKAITNAGLDPKKHFKIANPLSADFEYMRTSLVPGALQIIAENQGLFSEGKLFDLSKVYIPIISSPLRKGGDRGGSDLADEKLKLLIAVFNSNQKTAFNDAKGIAEGLMRRLNIDLLSFRPNPPTGGEVEKSLNQIQIVDQKLKSAFGLKKEVVLIELDFDALRSAAKVAPEYKPIPKFPSIELDLSLEAAQDTTFADISSVAQATNINLIEDVSFLSIYEGPNMPEGKKGLAIRIIYRDPNKTLKLKEAQDAHDKVVAELKKEYNIVVR